MTVADVPKTYFEWHRKWLGAHKTPCWSYVEDGWVPLLDRLAAELVALGWDRDLHQCKEKFGGLRFYVGANTAEMAAAIERAEQESLNTCAKCGMPGMLMGKSCVRTLCQECGINDRR